MHQHLHEIKLISFTNVMQNTYVMKSHNANLLTFDCDNVEVRTEVPVGFR